MARIALFLSPVAVLLALAGAPATAAAAPQVGIADDRMLLAGGTTAETAVRRWAALGVDVVRIHAVWSRIAPRTRSRRPPAGFASADPQARGYAFGALDEAIGRVTGAGMQVMLTITGPGPLWATSRPQTGNRRLRPRPSSYAAFATAVARRYAGRVASYILWNEPNEPGWLQPQWTCRRGRCTPASPHVYRGLVNAAAPAVRAADPGARVLVGALAPRGAGRAATNLHMSPLTFVRAFGCVDARFRRVRGGACSGFRPAVADGVAHHPLGGKNAPTAPFRAADDLGFASLGRLESTLDRLQRAGRVRSPTGARLPLFLDETGWQTNPPDPVLGVAPSVQDRWLQQMAYLASRDARISVVTQYVWRDEPLRAGGSGWQAGLLFRDGRAKPALGHFARPFWVDPARNRLWGQVRPGGAHAVAVQSLPRGARAWRTFATLPTSADGVWSLERRLARGTAYRFVADGRASAAMRR